MTPEEAVKKAILEEREACAKICDDLLARNQSFGGAGYGDAVRHVAFEIRARSIENVPQEIGL